MGFSDSVIRSLHIEYRSQESARHERLLMMNHRKWTALFGGPSLGLATLRGLQRASSSGVAPERGLADSLGDHPEQVVDLERLRSTESTRQPGCARLGSPLPRRMPLRRR